MMFLPKYKHIHGENGVLYMRRWWIFNRYDKPWHIKWLPSVIFHDLSDKFELHDRITLAHVEAHIDRVQPPDGYAYVTLQKDDVRVGFNVPAHVFQEQKT